MNYTILVVEDEQEISSVIVKYIQKEGYQSLYARNGFEALELFSKQKCHLVILDIMMPGISGFEVLTELRAISDVPIILLTAKALEIDRLQGFDLGADDYVVKPFSPRELMKRVQVSLKRSYGDFKEPILMAGSLILHLDQMKLMKNNKAIDITTAEFQLLKIFMQNQNCVLSREQLIELAFGINYEGIDRNVDTYIKRLRQKIEDDPKHPRVLTTKYGAGYLFGGDWK